MQLPAGDRYRHIKSLLAERQLHSVCQEANCPNLGECWAAGTATIMVLGDVCTRACRFCAVRSGNPRGVVDAGEPTKVAEAAALMQLRYLVLTSVDRDDLPDGGA
ncbi:MAG: lipoyl synthase, partial [Planctomycetota bacterium]